MFRSFWQYLSSYMRTACSTDTPTGADAERADDVDDGSDEATVLDLVSLGRAGTNMGKA